MAPRPAKTPSSFPPWVDGLIRFLLILLLVPWLGACSTTPAPPLSAGKRIALTFDDVPRSRGPFLSPEERTERLIAALKRAGVEQAAFFVNPCHIGSSDGAGGEKRIDAYVAAGHVIANHSCTHPHLSGTSASAYFADIDTADDWLRGRPGFRPWFRYPFLDEGQDDKTKRDAIRDGLAERGLTDGYVTAEGSDWNIEALTIQAIKDGKPIDREALRDLYVETHVEAADFADALMQKAIGRQPAQVMLLHETDIAALYIDDLVRALRNDGWEIIAADEAYADPVAKQAATYDTPSAQGTLTEMLAWQKGLPAPRWYERNTLRIANRLYRERVLKEKSGR